MSKTRDELLAARAEREAAAIAAKTAHEDLVLELEDRFSNELGVRGAAFEIVNEENTNGEGPIVLKLGDPAADKLWKSKPGAAPEDALVYVGPSVVYPERLRFNEIAHRRPNLLLRCAAALSRLFGFSEEVLKGKA